jgi:hypothetical protein
MAKTPKDRRPEARPQEPALETRAPKQAAPPTPSGEARAARKKVSQKPNSAHPITAEERWNMIATAAYYRAEKRGFVGGDSAEDWAAAEAEVDAQLAGRKS